ncbi:YbaK/prolyl-tRNA synthetase associated region [Alkaliphilus metalliredigens QYMF]|uniref:YbaK/prolyl-tRNA synthetase associated region n=1 Tax=Alkaliphilus metalliredigens (strain QYMF) TaxID=293826 RepID=A6TN64_ALKMQ|nr:YbaK/EbsC family protein [Alkaliphilus metalliredigens]ABR47632.1 YbaK/prolyl-tRNA synthetase associated region [Alkaliphilus metalliredigens QYMF]
MKQYEEKLKGYISESNIVAEQLVFENVCHSVEEAANTVGASPEDLVKNICMVDNNDNLIVAIVKGEDRASTKRVGKALNIEAPRTANEGEILEKTGFPCGGVPSFGYQATFIIDPKVMEKESIYTGGGSPHSLVRIASQELQRANNGLILKIRK